MDVHSPSGRGLIAWSHLHQRFFAFLAPPSSSRTAGLASCLLKVFFFTLVLFMIVASLTFSKLMLPKVMPKFFTTVVKVWGVPHCRHTVFLIAGNFLEAFVLLFNPAVSSYGV